SRLGLRAREAPARREGPCAGAARPDADREDPEDAQDRPRPVLALPGRPEVAADGGASRQGLRQWPRRPEPRRATRGALVPRPARAHAGRAAPPDRADAGRSDEQYEP